MIGDNARREALDQCEAACRRLCAECLRASAFANAATPWHAAVLDVSYVAASAARVLARNDDHDWGSVLMLVSACQEISSRSAGRWRRADPMRLRDCVTAAEACAAASAVLLRLLVPASRRTEEQPVVEFGHVDNEGAAA
jgi:hypothetical protein